MRACKSPALSEREAWENRGELNFEEGGELMRIMPRHFLTFLFIGEVSWRVDALMRTLDGQADMVYCADANRNKCMVAHECMALSMFLNFYWNDQKKKITTFKNVYLCQRPVILVSIAKIATYEKEKIINIFHYTLKLLILIRPSINTEKYMLANNNIVSTLYEDNTQVKENIIFLISSKM